MNDIQKNLLKEIVNLDKLPNTAFSFRENGETKLTQNSENVEIKKTEKGLDFFIKANSKNCILHLPVIITKSGVVESVENNFFIGENAEVVIVAGCGIHNNENKSEHNGIHSFFVEKNCRVKYIEKHIGIGNGINNFNPITKIDLQDNSVLEMDIAQVGGIKNSQKKVFADLEGKNTTLKINERILTSQDEKCNSNYDIELNGENSKANITSKNVAKENSYQEFTSNIKGKNKCYGRVECDGILLDNAIIISTPCVKALCKDAELFHEASVGKIAGEQLLKLQSLGLDEQQAENVIIESYLQ